MRRPAIVFTSSALRCSIGIPSPSASAGEPGGRLGEEEGGGSRGWGGEIGGRGRGPDPAGRERTRVAVGEYLGAVRDERQSRLPDPLTHGTVFFPDGRRLGLEPLPDARAPPAVRRLRRDTRHAVERPAQVHGGGPRRREQPRQLVEGSEERRVGKECRSRWGP